LRLLTLAEQFGFAIVEDDYDHEFHFAHRPMLPLASVDRHGKVVYIGSMSKLLAPSLRLGYIAAPVSAVERAAAEIMLIDRQGDPATEGAVAEMMEAGDIRRHARKVRRIYGERREILAESLHESFGGAVDFVLPDGGLALWLGFSGTVDMELLAREAQREGVRFLPGQSFATGPEPVQAARLGFGSLNRYELTEAVKRLRRAYDAATR
jgi:GntR family transcriptional regulator/MocR family aminotransferase